MVSDKRKGGAGPRGAGRVEVWVYGPVVVGVGDDVLFVGVG